MSPIRIVVVGTSGMGKSTLAKKLSEKYSIPFVELDELHFKPNWEEVSKEVFQTRLRNATNSESWVVAGNYNHKKGDLWERSTHIIWLNYPFWFSFSRLVKRTIKRCWTKEELYTGCYENWRMSFFSSESIIVWFFKTYWKRKREYPQILKNYSNQESIILNNQKKADLFLEINLTNYSRNES